MRIGSPGFNGERLIEAREVRGVSATALAMLVGVTPASISQYQSGTTTPSSDVLSKIADKLGFPEDFFFLPNVSTRETATFFRSKANNTKAARQAAEWRIKWLARMADYLTTYLDIPRYTPLDAMPADPLSITDEHIEQAATALRRSWSMGDGAIGDLTLFAENNGVVVSRHRLYEEREHAFSKPLLDYNRDYIIVNSDINSAVHSRFSLAHELGHMMLHRQQTEQERLAYHKINERQANHFAGALLLPRTTFPEEFTVPDIDLFARLKRKWKVSVGAMIMRCRDLGLVDESEFKAMQIKYRRRKWHRGEPHDNELEPETPRLFRRSFQVLHEAGLQRRENVLQALPYPTDELEAIAALPKNYFAPSRAPIPILEITPRGSEAESSEPASGPHARVFHLDRR